MQGLWVNGLGVTREGKEVLKDLRLQLSGGQLAVVLGPSGSGKSTLLKALMGFLPSRGTVRWRGQDLLKNFDQLKGELGYVPQDDVLHTDLKVRACLEYSARLRLPQLSEEQQQQRVESILNTLELKPREHLRIKKLSGGQRKRVSVGLELLTEPQLLLMDEPTSGLDPALEAQMMQLFRKLASGDRVCLLSTHVTASLDLVDVALMVADGYLVYRGPPADIPQYFDCANLAEVYRKLASVPAGPWARKLAR